VSWDLPSLAPGATSLLDVTVNGARAGDLVQASLVPSTRFIELDAAVWSNNTMRVLARNISASTFDLAAATLSVGVAKRRALQVKRRMRGNDPSRAQKHSGPLGSGLSPSTTPVECLSAASARRYR
jgi:hypothetical protein